MLRGSSFHDESAQLRSKGQGRETSVQKRGKPEQTSEQTYPAQTVFTIQTLLGEIYKHKLTEHSLNARHKT